MRGQQRRYRGLFALPRKQRGAKWRRDRGVTGRIGQLPQARGVMQRRLERNPPRAEQAPTAGVEPDPFRDSCQKGQRGGTARPLREIGALRPDRTQLPRHTAQPAQPAIRAALVEHDDAGHGGMVAQQRRIGRRGHHMHTALTSQPLEERGGEDHVAEKAGLQDRRDHVVSRPGAPPGRPPAESPRCPPASCASCLPSASPEACACGRCRRRSTWPARPCEAASRSHAQ